MQLGLLLSEVGTTNKIEVTAEEVNRALVQQAQRYPGQEQQIIKMYQENQQAMASLRAPIFEEKVVDFILEMAKVTDRAVSVEELMQEPETEASEETKKPAAKPKRKRATKAKKADAGTDKDDTEETT